MFHISTLYETALTRCRASSFRSEASAAATTDGPHFIAADIEVCPTDYGYPHIDESDNKYRFQRWLERLEGRKILEDAIDVKMSMDS